MTTYKCLIVKDGGCIRCPIHHIPVLSRPSETRLKDRMWCRRCQDDWVLLGDLEVIVEKYGRIVFVGSLVRADEVTQNAEAET
jgi:hypothetical protein